MNDAGDITCIRIVMEESGLTVESVPECRLRRCDLLASDEIDKYYVEVKGVYDGEEVVSALRKHGIYHGERKSPRKAPLLRRIETALKQIKDTDDQKHDTLWLVALIEHGPLWSSMIIKDIIATLYGIRSVIELGPPPRDVGECIYFDGSAFHKYRLELDGVIIAGADGYGLCVNDYSDRANRVRSSRLGRYFAEHKMLHDVERLEKEGGYLVADCDMDRNDEPAVLRYLSLKYGLTRPIALRGSAFCGAVSVH